VKNFYYTRAHVPIYILWGYLWAIYGLSMGYLLYIGIRIVCRHSD